VRDDPLKGKVFRLSDTFEKSTFAAAKDLDSDMWGKDSLSGNERNRLFHSQNGKQFTDTTLLSGADHLGDGRSVALWDYDHDGKTDIASVNTNAPKLVLFHNQTPENPNHFIALRFEGGNQSPSASTELSNRDAYGTRITLICGNLTIIEEHRCGEGYSNQNSRTKLIGIGAAEKIDSLDITWPSGKTQQLQNIPVDQLITLKETAPHKTELYKP
jgi:hypothetical protein